MNNQLDVYVDLPAEVPNPFPDPTQGPAQVLQLLRGALARADHRPGAASVLPALMDAYGLRPDGAALPLGAFSRIGEADAEAVLRGPALQWWRADPVHLAAGRDELRLHGTTHLQLSAQESAALGQAVAQHLQDDGITVHIAGAARWYLGFAQPLDCLASAPGPLDGRNIWPGLPVGPDALRLRALVNEIQMLLHEHPVNQAREARGERVVNSVWAWGGGVLPAPAQGGGLGALISENPVLRGIWRHTDAAAAVLSADSVGQLMQHLGQAPAGSSDARASVLWLDADRLGTGADPAQALQAFEERWFAPLYAALSEGALARLRLVFAGHVFTLNARQRWRLWRRASRLPVLPGMPAQA